MTETALYQVGTDLHMYMYKTYTQKRWELVWYVEVSPKGTLHWDDQKNCAENEVFRLMSRLKLIK